MPIQKLPGSAIAPGTITVVQLESTVATTVQTGGGPKLTNIQITDNAYTVLDDTAVDVTGGYIKITGTGFVTGCSVIVGQLPAASVTFISSTEVRAQLSAQSAGTYIVYLVNPDGGVGIRVNGVTHSANPAWQTASSLGEQYDGVAINLSLVATDATSYTITSGSLPPGLSLNGNTGVISGTVSGVANDTLYTFTVLATDAQLQDSPRTFTVTITVSDAYFKLTTLLLSGSAIPVNTVIKDSSTNNFNLTVSGDARASNFTPYGGAWSVYFDGTGDYLSFADSAAFDLAINNFTIECWVYTTSFNSQYNCLLSQWDTSLGYYFYLTSSTIRFGYQISGSNLFTEASGLTNSTNTWIHLAVVRNSNSLTIYKNGTSVGSGSITGTINNSSNQLWISGLGTGSGALNNTTTHFGYISNIRLVNGTALYTANFTPATTNLTSVANTSLLTCHVNRFMDGSPNNFAITRNGDARVVSFNPFGITNTGVNGSMYFDGTGDYIDIASNAYWNFGDGTDFTIELWAYTNNLATQYIIWSNAGTNSSGYNNAYIYTNGTIGIGKAGVNEIISATSTWASAQWNHLAFVRNGSNLTIFYNGVSVASTASASTYLNNATAALSIGRNYQTSVAYFTGYISNYRVVKGTAIYTANFTPPTQPLTAIANTQLLTLQYDQPHNNHTFQDSSSNQFLITRNGNASQGTFSPFSPTGWSAYFDGTGDVLTIPDSAISQLGSSDFTLECWINTSKTTGGSILTKGVDENVTWGNFFFSLTSSNYLFFEIDPTPSTSADRFSLTDTVAISSGQWHHVAVTRSGNDWKLFRNGTIAASGTSSASFPDDTYAWVVGGSRVSGSTTATWVGYISNLRLIKGSAVYTTAFTPPTAPLSAITNTAFLICHTNRFIDASTNNFAITVTGDSKVVAFSPFAPTAFYNPATHGGSAYFDGTGDDLSIATNTAFTDLPGDWTIECWFYSTSTSNQMLAGTSTFNTSGYFLELNYTAAGRVSFVPVPWSNRLESSSAVFTNYTWNHIAYVRSGTTVTIYVNGTSVVSGTRSVTSNSQPLTIGQAGNGWDGRYYFNGYISNFRVVKGTAIYTTNFTSPTAPLTAITNTSLLLNFTDAAILDSTGRNVLETVADAKSSSVITKFTGGSMYFDGTGDSLITPASIVNSIGTGDFTIEFWCYPSNTAVAYRAIVASENYNSTAGGWSIYQNGTGIEIYLTGGALVTAASQLVASTWQHIALVRSGSASNNCKLYVNGTNVASATNTADWTGQKVFIGDNNYTGTDYFFNGYIQDLRITRGYARYTANFTAPTAPARLK